MSEFATRISSFIKRRIDAYVEDGTPPGGFLTAVLSNDLFGAIGRADPDSMMDLKNIIGYIYNDCPGNCWGSKEKVRDYKGSRNA